MGAPIGNQNGARAKVFQGAILRAFKLRSKDQSIQALDEIALALVDQARAGKEWAVLEIANRLDGKPAQQLIHSGDADSPLVVEILRLAAEKPK